MLQFPSRKSDSRYFSPRKSGTEFPDKLPDSNIAEKALPECFHIDQEMRQLQETPGFQEQEGDDQLQDIISRFLFFLKNRPDTTICRELQPESLSDQSA